MPLSTLLFSLSLILFLSACPQTEQASEAQDQQSINSLKQSPTETPKASISAQTVESPNSTAESAFVGTGLSPGEIAQLQTAQGKLLLPRPLKIGYRFQNFQFENNEGGGPGSGAQLDLSYTLPGGTELLYSCASSGVGSLPSNPDRAPERVEHNSLGSFEIFALQDGGSAAYTQFEIPHGGMDCHLISTAPDYALLKQVLMTLNQVL